MREITLEELEIVSGATVPLHVAGAIIGAATYAGEVMGGKEFSWGELAINTAGGALGGIAGNSIKAIKTGATVANTAQLANFGAAAGVLTESVTGGGSSKDCSNCDCADKSQCAGK